MDDIGYDVGNMKAWEDSSMTIEIPIESIPEEALREILGGIPIVRCKDCAHSEIDDPESTCQYLCHFYGDQWNGAEHYCSHGILRRAKVNES